MDADTYTAANIQVALVAELLEQLPLAEMLDAQAHAEAAGPIVDPTLFRSKAKAFQVDMNRTRILRKAQRALQELRDSQSR